MRSLLFVFLFATPLLVQAQRWEQRNHPQVVFRIQVIPRSLFENILQVYTDQTYLKAFRHLGDKHDFFHGHLLYTDDPRHLVRSPNVNGLMRPFAILYHTQEEASKFSLSDPGGKYDYLDRGTRSWVQFIDENNPSIGPIRNAYELMKSSVPNTKEAKSSLESTQTHYTIFTEQLDPQSFPPDFQFNIIGALQVDFFAAPCEANAELPINFLGFLKITLPGASAGPLCLNLTSGLAYTPVAFDGGTGERLPNPFKR